MSAELKRLYSCCPVFMEKEVKEKFYKGGFGAPALEAARRTLRMPGQRSSSHPAPPCQASRFRGAPACVLAPAASPYAAGCCKQLLWPLFHYVLPVAPDSLGRFDAEMWQAYVKANKASAPAAEQLAARQHTE